MRFLGATPAGMVDPVFGRDLSFYSLALPLYDDIIEIVIGILCVAIALWVVMGTMARSGTAAFAYRPDPFGVSHSHRNVALTKSGLDGPGELDPPRHGSRHSLVHRVGG
jgi:Uncharacterised protein family (UPF0182)